MADQPMQFMQLQPMQKNNNQQQMMQLLQATLARGAKTPGAAPGATPQVPQQTLPNGDVGPVQAGAQGAPGGFMNMPGMNMGMLGGLLQKFQGGAGGAAAPGGFDPSSVLFG